MRVRGVRAEDFEALARLNDAAVPNVNGLGLDGLTEHVERCDLALTVEGAEGEPAALLLALAPGREYASENYQWFSANQPPSLYVDRIVVAEHLRSSGVGAALYAEVFAQARRLELGVVTCEVNLEPPNPRSLAFHWRLGFRELGTLATKGGAVTVALLARPV